MQECNTKILTHFSTSFFDPKWQKETYLFVNTFFSKHRAHRAWLARMDNFSASKLFLSVCPHENCKLTSANLQVILVVVFFFLFPVPSAFFPLCASSFSLFQGVHITDWPLAGSWRRRKYSVRARAKHLSLAILFNPDNSYLLLRSDVRSSTAKNAFFESNSARISLICLSVPAQCSCENYSG